MHLLAWPEGPLIVKNPITVKDQSDIIMLGHQEPLKWEIKENNLIIYCSDIEKPCKHAWVLKLTLIKPLMTGCTATASGVFPGFPTEYAFDGNPGTRWGGAENSKSGWLAADLGASKTFNRVWISEALDRVRKFKLQVKTEGAWRTIRTGTTLGQDYSANFEPVTAQRVRLNILEATDVPTIWEFQLFAPKK